MGKGNMITPSQIIRCLIYDGYSLEEGVRYCAMLEKSAGYNPWSEPGDAEAYAEAKRRLEAKIQEREMESV